MSIHKNIEQSSTLDAAFYQSQSIFDDLIELAFIPSWQFLDIHFDEAFNQFPTRFLSDVIPEPLLIINEQESIRCVSNVCTHRGNLLVLSPQKKKQIVCNYHGRCFELSGAFRSMPAFDDVTNFPSNSDHLKSFATGQLGPMLFAQLENGNTFEDLIAPIQQTIPWFAFKALEYKPELSKDYNLSAHWCLYVDNYLEGFHVPFVHPGLHEQLDMSSYETQLFDAAVLQIGRADDEEHCFDIPESQPFYGENIYAFYFWLFPNIMVNIYPWGGFVKSNHSGNTIKDNDQVQDLYVPALKP